MSVILEPRIYRIRTLQRAYSKLQRDLLFLEERIYLLRVVIADFTTYLPDQSSSGHASPAQHRCDIGAALYARYIHVREPEDLDEAETHLRLALTHPSGRPFPAPSSLLGSVLRNRAYVTQSLSMCEEALSLHRQLFEESSQSSLEKAHHTRELGLTLRAQQVLGKKAKKDILTESIALMKESRAIYADNQVTDHVALLGLCETMVSLYYIQPDKSYMDKSKSYGELALELCGHTHRDFYWIAEKLAYVQRGHAWLFDDLESLDESIALCRAALVDAPPRWFILLCRDFVQSLQLCFIRLGCEEDLDEAVRCMNMLLNDSIPRDSDWFKLQDCISSMMLTRFGLTGIPEHIEAAAHASDLIWSIATTGSSQHLHALLQSARCRGDQYSIFGDIGHLQKCIELLERATQLTDTETMHGRAAASVMLENLHKRYEATGDMEDLDRAVALLPVLAASRNKKDTNATFELQNAGNVLLSRYALTGALADLEQATKLHQEAARDCTTFNQYDALCAYSTTLRIRYEALHEEECASEGLELQKQAYEDSPDVHPHRAGVLCGLARWKLCTSSEQSHVGEALDHLLAALNHRYSPAYRRLKNVSDVLSYQGTLGAHLSSENMSKLSLVYAAAIALLPQVASFGLEPRVRLAVISGAGQLTAQGAVHAIVTGQLEVALEMLEGGRNVFWTQGLHLRTPFADLPEDIGDRLMRITYALARPFPEELEEVNKDRELARRRRLGDEFRTALAEARQVPGCENILLNASFKSLVQAARHLMVVLVTSKSSGYAIVIRDAQCRLVTLAQATTSTLQALSLRIGEHTRMVRSSRGMRLMNTVRKDATAAYRELWTLVMQPIVIALQLSKAQGRQRQRLTLCPTGIFMQLPLHAAGVYTGKNQVCCSDYFVSSYTPSIAALLHAQQSLQPVRRSDATTLLVAVDQPFQGTALPMTRKEADIVQKYVTLSSEVIQASTCSEVLEHIQSASIVHLACHGTQNASDALQSGFHLENGLLSVSKLMELQLPRAFLAVLGACETAKGDATQPDQAIHLAAAMLFAGFKSVVATMWFMGDLEGPVIAEGIYSALFKDGNVSEHLDPDDVPYALDDVVRKLRESGLDPSFWATYVHIGI